MKTSPLRLLYLCAGLFATPAFAQAGGIAYTPPVAQSDFNAAMASRPVMRAGSGTTDSSGNLTVTFSAAFATKPAMAIVVEGSTTYSCLATTLSATGFTINCATITYGALGGQPQRTNVQGVTVDWHAMVAN